MASRLSVGIIGLGKFGFRFGQALMDLGHEVLGVDSDAANVRRAQQVFTQCYRADAMDKNVLQQLGFAELDHVLVSVGESIAASSMISMYLKELADVSVWVKATSSDHEKLLRKIGVDEVIIPEHYAAELLANRMAIPGFVEYLPFEKEMAIKEIQVRNWTGKSLRQIDLTNQYNVQVIARKEAGAVRFRFIPKADDPLAEGDLLVVIGHVDQLAKLKP